MARGPRGVGLLHGRVGRGCRNVESRICRLRHGANKGCKPAWPSTVVSVPHGPVFLPRDLPPGATVGDLLLILRTLPQTWAVYGNADGSMTAKPREPEHRERWQWWQGRWYHLTASGEWELNVPEAEVPQYIRDRGRGDPGTT